ncbi:MAG TPA: cytochrome c3 family protein [Blastocatellia bacterium]|nr:cytochrome c3 family protein [Blastocatellia bacterium]
MSVNPIKKGLLVAGCLLAVAVGVEPHKASPYEIAQAGETVSRERASYPHEGAAHKKLDCSNCHSIRAGEIDVKEFPGHADCVSCHNFALEVFRQPATFCGICHQGRASSRTQASLFEFPKPRVRGDFGIDFSHAAHMKPLKATVAHLELTAGQAARCTDCHRPVEPLRGPPEMTLEASHEGCFKCHGQSPIAEPGMRDCDGCHKLDAGRAPHLFGIVRGFRHEDHTLDTRPKRKSEARAGGRVDLLCVECHKSVASAASLDDIKLPPKSYCVECHNGRVGLPDRLADEILESLERR